MESNEHSVTTSGTGYNGVSSAVAYTVEYSSSNSAVAPTAGSVYIVETSTTNAAQVLASSGSAVQVSVASESSAVAPTAGSVYIVETSTTNAAQVLASTGSAVQVSAASESSANSTASQIAKDLMSMSVSIETVEAGVSLHAGSSSSHLSVIENSILSANNPLEFNETESLTVHGNTGLWLNRTEIVNWKGEIPITQYLINEDLNPEVIRKKTEQRIIYEQEVAVRYLRPPTPPPPGEILIRQEKNIPTPPAPPLVIRQVPPRPETPAPLVVREAPPRPPAAVGQKVITISGKRLPPPPRKVVIERLAPLPSKPQAIMVERWLPYGQSKRKVIFQKNTVADPVIAKPRNIIVQWDVPEVQIKKDFKDLGVIRANPVEYVERYGASLVTHLELPQFVTEIRPPVGVTLAAEFVAPSLIDLEGDVEALRLIDLDQEGLAEYRAYLARFSSQTQISTSNVVISSASGASVNSALSSKDLLNAIIMELFQSVDTNKSGQISRGEAESLLLRLNIRLGRSYTQADATAFVQVLDVNGDGVISFEEFRSALLKNFA
jgi:hypothetical protein